MNRLLTVILILLLQVGFLPSVYGASSDRKTATFRIFNTQNGLSDNHIWQLLQLPDGRMVVVMPQGISIYDGMRFNHIPTMPDFWMSIPFYRGYTHIYAGGNDMLWMKHRGRMTCFDLRHMRQVTAPDSLFNALYGFPSADDFFVDGQYQPWIVKGRQLLCPLSDPFPSLTLPVDAGELQDVDMWDGLVYAFFDTGVVIVYNRQGEVLHRSQAYADEERERYHSTSLVVRGFDNHFYQIRCGLKESTLLSFDTRQRQWERLMDYPKIMHTLTVTPEHQLYLSAADSYWRIDLLSGSRHQFRELLLPDGSVLSTGLNAICLDREGGLWLGSYDRGILYTSPLSGIFDTRPLDIDVDPILTDVFLHSQPLRIGQSYDGRVLIDEAPPYVDHLVLSHDQNSLAFQFSTMNYVRPRSTCYRYRFSGDDYQWHVVTADSAGNMVDDQGIFYLPLVDLAPGNYSLEVQASTNPDRWDSRSIRQIWFTIQQPWWSTPLAYVLYGLAFILVPALAVVYYYRRLRLRMERRRREDMLLLRIQNLADQVNLYEHTSAMVVLQESDQDESESDLSEQDVEFMSRATQLVEQNIANTGYTVEQLAADLCMERTGLYKKLTQLMDKSPVVFIRGIRLHRAAELLRQGGKTVTEIAEETGFGSVSYFSKCFQKEFGCKPSEYQ